MIDLKEIFDSNRSLLDPNSYTEKAMPAASALYDSLSDITYSNVSNAVTASRYKIEQIFDDIDYDLFDRIYDAYAEERRICEKERFNLGFKLGALLMMDILKKGV